VPDQRIATVDQDATIIESHKQQLSTYEGCEATSHAGGVGETAWCWPTSFAMAMCRRDGARERCQPRLPPAGTVGSITIAAIGVSGKRVVNWCAMRSERRAARAHRFAISARMSDPCTAHSGGPDRLGNLTARRSAEVRECADVRLYPGRNREERFATPSLCAFAFAKARTNCSTMGGAVRTSRVVEPVGIKAGALDRMAPRKGRDHRAGHDVIKNDLGGECCLRILRSQRRVAALGGDRDNVLRR